MQLDLKTPLQLLSYLPKHQAWNILHLFVSFDHSFWKQPKKRRLQIVDNEISKASSLDLGSMNLQTLPRRLLDRPQEFDKKSLDLSNDSWNLRLGFHIIGEELVCCGNAVFLPTPIRDTNQCSDSGFAAKLSPKDSLKNESRRVYHPKKGAYETIWFDFLGGNPILKGYVSFTDPVIPSFETHRSKPHLLPRMTSRQRSVAVGCDANGD